MKPSYFCLPCQDGAFSLVEVTAALGICAFCLLAIFGLLPVGIKSGQTATEQTAAAGLLSMVAVDLRETPPSARASAFFKIPVPANPVGADSEPAVLYFNGLAQSSTAALADSRYRLSVRFLRNDQFHKMATLADVAVTWPAAAAPSEAAGRVRTLVAVDRN